MEQGNYKQSGDKDVFRNNGKDIHNNSSTESGDALSACNTKNGEAITIVKTGCTPSPSGDIEKTRLVSSTSASLRSSFSPIELLNKFTSLSNRGSMVTNQYRRLKSSSSETSFEDNVFFVDKNDDAKKSNSLLLNQAPMPAKASDFDKHDASTTAVNKRLHLLTQPELRRESIFRRFRSVGQHYASEDENDRSIASAENNESLNPDSKTDIDLIANTFETLNIKSSKKSMYIRDNSERKLSNISSMLAYKNTCENNAKSTINPENIDLINTMESLNIKSSKKPSCIRYDSKPKLSNILLTPTKNASEKKERSKSDPKNIELIVKTMESFNIDASKMPLDLSYSSFDYAEESENTIPEANLTTSDKSVEEYIITAQNENYCKLEQPENVENYAESTLENLVCSQSTKNYLSTSNDKTMIASQNRNNNLKETTLSASKKINEESVEMVELAKKTNLTSTEKMRMVDEKGKYVQPSHHERYVKSNEDRATAHNEDICTGGRYTNDQQTKALLTDSQGSSNIAIGINEQPENDESLSKIKKSKAQNVIHEKIGLTGGNDDNKNNCIISIIGTPDENQNKKNDDMLKHNQLLHEEKLLQKDTELYEKENMIKNLDRSIQALKQDISEINDAIKKMEHLRLSVYETTIREFSKENKTARVLNDLQREDLNKKNDQLNQDVLSAEQAYSDVQRKLERNKELIAEIKEKEERMRKSLSGKEFKLEEAIKRYEVLQNKTRGRADDVHRIHEETRNSKDAEILKLQTMLRRADMHVSTLQDTLDQKTKENCTISKMCDDLISKATSKQL